MSKGLRESVVRSTRIEGKKRRKTRRASDCDIDLCEWRHLRAQIYEEGTWLARERLRDMKRNSQWKSTRGPRFKGRLGLNQAYFTKNIYPMGVI